MRLTLLFALPLATAALSVGAQPRYWDVKLRGDGVEHVLRVPEGKPILRAAEQAGLMPTSECRRGNCLSCVAEVLEGAPFSLRVSEHTALCQVAKDANLIPLCSAFATGPGLVLALDEARRRQSNPRPLHLAPERPSPAGRPA